MGTRVAGPSLTAREREVARQIGLGLTNREIAEELGISDRTVGAHVQNILNKLAATNRAQIAAWSAQHLDTPPVPPLPAIAAASTPQPGRPGWSHRWPNARAALLVVAGLAISTLFPADHVIQPASAVAAISSQRGDLVFEAHFDPDGHEFSVRQAMNDPTASDIRFVDGAIEYSILKSTGNTQNRPGVTPVPAYFAEYEISVKPRSNLTFWIMFSTDDPSRYPVHLLDIETGIETMQLAYFSGGDEPPMPLGPQVAIHGLQDGRKFTISTLVQPPNYRVFMDGVRVIDVIHESARRLQAPVLGIFGDPGTVRLSALRIYRVA